MGRGANGPALAGRAGAIPGSRRAPLALIPRQVPPLALLAPGEAKPNDLWDINEKVRRLDGFFAEQKLGVVVSDIACGPMTTSFGLTLPPGTLTATIKRLQADIGMRLGNADSTQVRIVGSRVWIDLPNSNPDTVALRDLIESPEYQRDQRSAHPAPLLLPIGRDTQNRAICADLTTMPHMLVAGQSGSGKSVFLSAIITSVLATRDPREVELTLIDPKRTEMSMFAGVPHIAPVPGVAGRGEVITEVDDARRAMKAIIAEMKTRFQQMQEAGVTHDLRAYNRMAQRAGLPPLPYRIVIIDELAALGWARGNTKEERRAAEEFLGDLTYIASLARGAGIHLVAATQSPRVDYMPGGLKANCPARVAFSVAQGVESNIILDEPGAEQLARKGDMLFRNSGVPARMRGPYVSDDEAQSLVAYWRRNPLAAALPGTGAPDAPRPARAAGSPGPAPAGGSGFR